MPAYVIIEKGFINDRIYDIGENLVRTTKFQEVPSWMLLVSDKEESKKLIEAHNENVHQSNNISKTTIGEIVNVER